MKDDIPLIGLQQSRQQPINFTCSPNDFMLAREIAHRGVLMARQHGVFMDVQQCHMDIVACHCNGTELDLIKFLHSDPAQFAHDFAGITRHMNRADGKLYNFEPFFAKRNEGKIIIAH